MRREKENEEKKKKTNTVCEEIEKNLGNAWNSRRVNMSLDVGVCGSFGRCPNRDTDEKVIKNCLLLLLFISCFPFSPLFFWSDSYFFFVFFNSALLHQSEESKQCHLERQREKTRSFAKEIEFLNASLLVDFRGPGVCLGPDAPDVRINK